MPKRTDEAARVTYIGLAIVGFTILVTVFAMVASADLVIGAVVFLAKTAVVLGVVVVVVFVIAVLIAQMIT